MSCFDLRKKVKGKNTSSSDSEITLLLVVEVGVEKDGCISEKTLDKNGRLTTGRHYVLLVRSYLYY